MKISGVTIEASPPTTYRCAYAMAALLGQTALRYMPFNTLTENSVPTAYTVTLPVPSSGQVIAISLWATSTSTITVSTHKNGSATIIESDTIACTGGVPATFLFSSTTFSQDDELHFGVSGTSNPNGTIINVILEYDI